jgi:hypothetical protein
MRSFVVMVLLGIGFGADARPKPKPVRYDLTHLAASHNGSIPLVGGKSLSLPSSWNRKRIVFVDLVPGANWRHPARIRVESPEGRLESEIRVDSPPPDLTSLEVISGVPPVPRTPLEFKVQNLKGRHRVADPDRHWAFLLNGNSEQRHWNDFSFLYRVLVEVYGYHPAQIVMADTVFQNRKPDLDGNGTPDIAFGSTQAEVKRAFAHLSSHLKKTDKLLFVVNDHGGIVDGEATIVLYDVEVKASAFLTQLATVPSQEVISVYGQCNSGGFVRPSIAQGRVAIAAATDLELSWATTDFQFDEFLYHFISALGFQRHDGTAVSADTDGDGRVSVKEAFVFAQAADKSPESPLLESFTNTGKAMDFGVGY